MWDLDHKEGWVSESQSVLSDSCDPMDCSLPGSSVHGILQARILEWVAISFSRGSSQPRNQILVSCIAGKKAEHWRIYAFELWCWRRLLWVPWTARRSNQSILKEINSEYSLEGLMLSWSSKILWSSDAKSWLIWKDPDAMKDRRQKEKRAAEDEMIQ